LRPHPAWAALQGHFEAHGRDLDLREAFARDPGALRRLQPAGARGLCRPVEEPVDIATRRFLLDLARECGVEAAARRDARRRAINTTEGRAVLHTALRAPRGAGPFSDEVHGVLDAMLAYADACAPTRGGFTDVVNIGIGGSDLGPAMVVPALDALPTAG
jgi:glucose-6-phosphate isomerase